MRHEAMSSILVSQKSNLSQHPTSLTPQKIRGRNEAEKLEVMVYWFSNSFLFLCSRTQMRNIILGTLSFQIKNWWLSFLWGHMWMYIGKYIEEKEVTSCLGGRLLSVIPDLYSWSEPYFNFFF